MGTVRRVRPFAVPDFETQLDKLVTDFPGLCSVESAANKTANGNSVYFVRIADDKVARMPIIRRR